MEAIRAGTTQGKILHAFQFIFLLSAWIGCCVGFGAPLLSFSLTPGGGVELTGKIYYAHATFDSTSTSESMTDFGYADCDSSGKGLVAMLVFAFLVLLFLISLFLLRIFGQLWRIHTFQIHNIDRCILIELILTIVAAFFYFLAVVIWTSKCLSSLRDVDNLSITILGYGFIVACLFFLIFVIFILLVLRADPSSIIGDLSTKAARGAYVQQTDGAGHYDDRLYGDGEPLGGGVGGGGITPGGAVSTTSYQYGGQGSAASAYPPAVSYQAAGLDDNAGL